MSNIKSHRSFVLSFAAALALSALPLFADDTSAGGLVLSSKNLAAGKQSLVLDGFFFETEKGPVTIPVGSLEVARRFTREFSIDGRTVKLSVEPDGKNFMV